MFVSVMLPLAGHNLCYNPIMAPRVLSPWHHGSRGDDQRYWRAPSFLQVHKSKLRQFPAVGDGLTRYCHSRTTWPGMYLSNPSFVSNSDLLISDAARSSGGEVSLLAKTPKATAQGLVAGGGLKGSWSSYPGLATAPGFSRPCHQIGHGRSVGDDMGPMLLYPSHPLHTAIQRSFLEAETPKNFFSKGVAPLWICFKSTSPWLALIVSPSLAVRCVWVSVLRQAAIGHFI